MRPHTTLVSGAAGIELGTFLFGAVPSLLIWLCGWLFIGILVGVPAEHDLHRFERVALRGALLAAVAVAGFVGVRRPRVGEVHALARLPAGPRPGMAVVLDGSLVAGLVAGLLAVGRRHGD